jgi:undecaprenyl-diphosphatase
VNTLQAIILGLVQGLTEFIPVSSSGHLVLLHQVMSLNESGLAFDVALHFGTLLALIIYFYKDIWQLVLGILGKNDMKKLAWLLVVATIPAVISGVLLETAAESTFRSVRLVAFNLALVAFIMLGAEWFARRYERKKQLNQISATDAVIIGLAQASSVVPGVSRSGSTITTGLFLGLDRVAATRFSFLLGIPIISGAVLKVLVSVNANQQISTEPGLFLIGISTALVSGLFAIRFLLRYLSGHTLAVFAYYRLALAAFVILQG